MKTKMIVKAYRGDGEVETLGEVEGHLQQGHDGELIIEWPFPELASMIAAGYRSRLFGHNFELDVPYFGMTFTECSFDALTMGAASVGFLSSRPMGSPAP